MKRKMKILVDIVMYFIFIYLMSYRAGRGLFLHGVLGCVLFGLFLLHHILNLAWYRGILKGGYSFQRAALVFTDFLLLADMAAMMISSVQMSGDVFAFSPFVATQSARNLHTCGTAWGFVWMAFHLGFHTHGLFRRLYRKIKDTFFGYTYVLLFLLVWAAGIRCFIVSGIWKDMILLHSGSMAFEDSLFYLQYGMITLAACQTVHLLLAAAACLKKRKKTLSR